jgi:histidinol-phosphate aminotransferase
MNLNEALLLIRGSVRGLKAYHLEPEECSIKLNQNENPFDWPGDIKEEMGRFCVQRPWNRYPPFIPDALKNSLAEYVGTAKSSIIVGNGSNEMLLVLLLSFAEKGSPVIICQPTFTIYRLLIDGLGATAVPVSLNPALQYDLAAICAAIASHPGALLVLSSPNNPTGCALNERSLREILRQHSGFCVLDQAYVEFGGFDAMPLLREFPNLIITRTFSKAFAGAALRLGYLVGNPAVINEINKIKLPYNLNFFSEHAASMLLRHGDLLRKRIALIKVERDVQYAFLRTIPFDAVYPSEANFILVRYRKKSLLVDALKERGILVRDVSSYPLLDNCLRIGIGTPDENELLRTTLRSFFSDHEETKDEKNRPYQPYH